jgi:hypothetical protein
MSIEYFRDDHFRIIGSIETDMRGVQVAKSARYEWLGEYDPRTNTTKDAPYRTVGSGDQVSALARRTLSLTTSLCDHAATYQGQFRTQAPRRHLVLARFGVRR